MRMLVVGSAVGLAAVTLAACASASGATAGGPAGTPSVQPRWTSCAADAPPPSPEGGLDALTLPRLGSDFAPLTVIICSEQIDQRADGGQDLVATESRADDITGLVSALGLPDERPTTGACTLELPTVPWFALLDAQGAWVRPGVPIDACGKVRIEVRDALAGLHLTRVSTRVLREVESAQAAASGCSQAWANMVAVESTDGTATPAAASSVLSPPTDRIRLCVYRVPASEQGTGKPAGDFQHGGLLTPQRQAAIEEPLLAAPPARDCRTEASRFALLISAAGAGVGATVYVELDGCQRIMVVPVDGHPVLAQANAGLIALLDR